MTDLPITMDDSTLDEARRARVAQLQSRRRSSPAGAAPRNPTASADPTTPAGTSRRPVRRHTAQGSRIAAAGLGVAVMLGLVGAMGVAQANSAGTTTLVTPAIPAPAPVVVVHYNTTGPANAGATAAASNTPASPSAPIALTAQPTVRQAPAAPAPIVKTNGSK